jgi:hypothetical protein
MNKIDSSLMDAKGLDELTRKHTAFNSFAELANPRSDYSPLLYTRGNAEREALADAYDRAMVAAGSQKRTFRGTVRMETPTAREVNKMRRFICSASPEEKEKLIFALAVLRNPRTEAQTEAQREVLEIMQALKTSGVIPEPIQAAPALEAA